LPEEIFEDTIPKLKISYCTTCMGRLKHLRKTYLKNITNNLNYDNIEFVLVNYNSADGLHEWVDDNLSSYISDGIVNYFYTKEPEYFHMSKAKNLAHRLATGDILVNLDADNYLGKNHALYLNYLYNNDKSGKKVFRFTKPDMRYYDTSGKIALRKIDFYTVGGYREDLMPYGEEDLDLLNKLSNISCAIENIDIINFLRTVKHSTRDRYRHLGSGKKLHEMRILNQRSIRGKYAKNQKTSFQPFTVYKNFSQMGLRV
jgi:predicted glycosyltransferase involved in capsule biosynthesis